MNRRHLFMLGLFAGLLMVCSNARAAGWEYATLSNLDGAFRSFIQWDSPKGDSIEAPNVAAMVVKLKDRDELSKNANAQTIFQLVQMLGREGWEVIESKDQREPKRSDQTFLLKRPTK